MKKILLITSVFSLATSYMFAQCQAGFTVNSSSSPNIAFTNTCSGVFTPAYYWDFDDGNTSSSVNPKKLPYFGCNNEYTFRLFNPENKLSLETRKMPVSTDLCK